MTTPPAVVARAVALGYRRDEVLTCSDFTAPVGGVTALVGPNGSGKSTILNAIAGLIRPLRGTIEVLGTSPEAARSRVAYVFQTVQANERLPLTVLEAVAMGRYSSLGLVRRLRGEDRAAINHALDRMAIGDLRNRTLAELSGGQRQRVLVAQGLAQDAQMLLLDEPVTGLDTQARDLIAAVLTEECAAGRTVVVSTHELDDAAAADHVLLLAGRVVASGSPPAVLTEEHLSLAYMGRIVRVGPTALLVDEARTDPHDRHHHHP